MNRSLVVCAAAVAAVASATVQSSRSPAGVQPIPASVFARLSHHEFVSMPNSHECNAILGVDCYSAAQLRAAYGVASLARQGIDGRGMTIAVVVSFGSPTVEQDLAAFDRVQGLPDPPSIRTITPAGTPPPFDPTNAEMSSWAYETTLDVEYAHAMAPGASILVVATPVSETEGIQGFPEIVRAEQYVVDHHLADVISQSFGATENTFPSRQSILDLRGAYQAAAASGITVLASSGDTGPTGYESDLTTLSSQPSATWPATDPLVTAVGGTALHLDGSGARVSDDTVWQDGYGASGGGLSELFDRPAFQDGVRDVVGAYRGTPDVGMSAAVDGGALVYSSYDPAETGWSIVGGTSESTPLFAGVVALAAQLAGHRLGDVNPALYRRGQQHNGVVDVTAGANSFGGVAGFAATAGYDLASGWGTVAAAQFVPALAGLTAWRG